MTWYRNSKQNVPWYYWLVGLRVLFEQRSVVLAGGIGGSVGGGAGRGSKPRLLLPAAAAVVAGHRRQVASHRRQ